MKKTIALLGLLFGTVAVAEVEELTDANQEKLKSGSSVVKFYSNSCPNCTDEKGFYAELSEKTPGIKFYKVNQPENPKLTQEHNVTALPTFIFFKNGEPAKDKDGNPKKIVGMHQAHVESAVRSLQRESAPKQMAAAPKKVRSNTH